MRLVIVEVDGDIDIAVPRGGRGISPCHGAMHDSGESLPLPGLLVEVEHGPSADRGRGSLSEAA